MDSFPKARDVDGAVQFNEKGNFSSPRSRQLIQDHRGFCFVLIYFFQPLPFPSGARAGAI
jgi:hypothetical protein